MPSINLSDFKGNLYDICRPNRFLINITGLDSSFGVTFSDSDYYLVKGCSIPGKTMGEIDLNWAGYKYKLAGDPTFNDVTMTFFNEIPRWSPLSLRDRFLIWLNAISNDTTNNRANHDLYKCGVDICQLDGSGVPIRTYSLQFAHPKDVSEIALAMDSTDSVEEFTVVFSYSYFTWTGFGGMASDSFPTAVTG